MNFHRALFGSGFDSDDDNSLLLPQTMLSTSLPDSDGYYSHGQLFLSFLFFFFGLTFKLLLYILCNANGMISVFLNNCKKIIESDFSEAPTQKGMDRYLDSLFDPVLSDGNGVSVSCSLPQFSMSS